MSCSNCGLLKKSTEPYSPTALRSLGTMSIKGNACWDWFLGIVMSGGFSFWANCALAQITPDSTLPTNSRVTPSGNINIIEGGTQSGSNLFHSFQQFSVPTGSTAHFNNAADIQNIISRVTGGTISNIDGLIRAEGKANLFLINPSGIVFGQNARLDVGGSFFASTATAIKFADGFEFSAIPQSAPLLTISVPIGLQFGINPGLIQVQGDGQGIRTTSNLIDPIAFASVPGLRVEPNQTLALVGGDINLNSATLNTAGGRIELGSVGDNSLVSLTPTNKGFSLNYSGVQNFKNIQLSQQAAVDASGLGSGDIQVVGRNIKLTDGSQIEASTLGSKPGGTLVVNAQDSVQLIGTSPDGNSLSGLFARVFPGATGTAGNLIINTRELLVQDGARVSATTFGAGKGGNLTVNADSVRVSGTSANGNESGLFAQTEPREQPGPIGQPVLSLTGAAGDITIKTRQLLVEKGGQIQAATFGAGKGGNLTVNADDSVKLTGIASNGRRLGSGLVASTAEGTRGAAGNVTIKTNQLLVEDGGRVVVTSRGTGDAGNLTVNARSIRLDKNATLSADTTSTSTNPNQATININSRDLILRRGSNITANATGSDVIGGNINIDTSILAAVENSPISANSADFRGGKIKINTSGIVRSFDSDITARGVSQEFNGTVLINTPDTDPSRGLLKLPISVVDTPKLIASSCSAFGKNGSSFTITGRGGLPPSPDDFLTSDVLWSDTRLPTATAQQHRSDKPAKPKPVEIIPATGWVINDKGDVTLISSVPNATSSVSPPTCAKQ